jgi:hypothetical protein
MPLLKPFSRFFRNLPSLAAPTALLLLAAVLLVSGCRSRGIDVTVQNNATVPLRNVEVDYPGAAFGTAIIKPGASYWYHIKPTDSGDLTLSFEQENGPVVKRKLAAIKAGEAGRMIVIVEQQDGKWTTSLTRSGNGGAVSPANPIRR